MLIRMRGRFAKWCFLLGTLTIFGPGFWNFIILKMPEVDLYEISADDYRKNMHVEMYINASYGCYATADETVSRNGRAVSTTQNKYRYYLIPAFTDDPDELKLLTVECVNADFFKYENLEEQTWRYLDGTNAELSSSQILCQGKLQPLDSEMRRYYSEWFKAVFPGEDPSLHLVPYYVEYLNTKEINLEATIFIIFILIFAVWLYLSIRAKNEQKNRETLDTYDAPTPTPSPYVPYQPTQDGRISFMGMSFLKTDLDSVDYYVKAGRTEEAVERLMSISDMSAAQAKTIISRWDSYYV